MYTTEIGDRKGKVFIQKQEVEKIATRKFFKNVSILFLKSNHSIQTKKEKVEAADV